MNVSNCMNQVCLSKIGKPQNMRNDFNMRFLLKIMFLLRKNMNKKDEPKNIVNQKFSMGIFLCLI